MDEALEMLYATGYHKPVNSLAVEDKADLQSVLLDYHCFLKVKSEMDQFVEGLGTTGVLNFLRNSPSTMFIAKITAG